MEFELTVGGLAIIQRDLNALIAREHDMVDKIIQTAGMLVEGDAQQHCPVRSGTLRKSITYTAGDLECTVGTDVDYAWYVELGTSKMAPHPFLFPAFEKYKSKLLQELILVAGGGTSDWAI